jgi:prevent-host-death family protein
MRPTYSITEARQKLRSIVEETAREECVQLTAHGKPVAVIVSMQVYEKLATKKTNFWPAYEAFRAATPLEDLKIESDVFDVRDLSPGREVSV